MTGPARKSPGRHTRLEDAMSKTSMKKTRRASRTEKTTQWKSWGETPSSCEVPNGQNMGEWEAATNRHRRLVQRRVRAIEAMLPMKNRKDQALAHHILAWLSYILSRRLSSSQVARDWAEKALKLDPTNDFTWSLLSGLYFFASHYVGYAEPGRDPGRLR